MSDKYPSISPYAYCAWNPVKLVDPDGREIEDDVTKYYNTKGKLLYETNDGLQEIVVVKGNDEKQLFSDLNAMNEENKLNDPIENKKLHKKYGGTLNQRQKEKSGQNNPMISDEWSSSYIDGFNDAFNGKIFRIFSKITCFSFASQGQNDNSCLSQSFLSIFGIDTGPNLSDINGGYICGATEGFVSKRNGDYNLFDPTFQNNKPLFNFRIRHPPML